MSTEHATAAPSRCPFCQSPTIVETGKAGAAENYWRCERCGELWHPARLQDTSRNQPLSRWGGR